METVIPVLAGASTLLATGTVLYRCIRPRFPVDVNCHFCDTSTQVPYGNQNCWDCPTCEQYNGFSEDGGYNKPIPAQFAEDMNHPISAERVPVDFQSGSESVLCEKCAQNQLLKVKQLANFVAYEECNYDAEVEAYQRNLEHVYRLCRDCQKKVDRSLRKQDEFLHRRLSTSGSPNRPDFHQHNLSFTAAQFCTLNVPLYVHMLRLLVVICSLLLLLVSSHNLAQHSKFSWQPHGVLETFCSRTADGIYKQSCYLVCIALFVNIVAIALAGKESLTVMDAASCFLWLALVILHAPSNEQLLVSSELLKLQPIITLLTSGVALRCMLGLRYKQAASPTRIRTRRLRPDSSFTFSTSSPFHDVVRQDVFHDVPPQSTSAEYVEKQNAEPEPVFFDPLEELETLSIGEPMTQNERGMFMDSPAQHVPATPHSISSLNSLRHRSIINPARFTSGQPRDLANSGGHKYVRQHSFGLPKNRNTLNTNMFQPTSHRSHNLFSSNGSIFANSSGGFSNGGTGSVFGNSVGQRNFFDSQRSIFDGQKSSNSSSIGSANSIHGNKDTHVDSNMHGIRSVHGTRPVYMNSGSVRGNRSSIPDNRNVNSKSGSILGNRSAQHNIVLNSNQVADDRASLLSQPHHTNLSNDSSAASSNESFVSQSRASTSCPVDTTFSEVPPCEEPKTSVMRLHKSSILWSLSLLFNLCFIGYVILYLLDYSILKSVQSVIGNTSIVSVLLKNDLDVPIDLLY